MRTVTPHKLQEVWSGSVLLGHQITPRRLDPSDYPRCHGISGKIRRKTVFHIKSEADVQKTQRALAELQAELNTHSVRD